MFVLLTFFLVSFKIFSYTNRFDALFNIVCRTALGAISSPVAKILYILSVVYVLSSNLLGNIPLSSIPTLFYSHTLTLSLLFWVPMMLATSSYNFKGYFSHLLPYGCPVGLMLFLPLIEGFSLMIRPLTLVIRLRTNLAAGHIMIYMFRYFTLLNPLLPIPIRILLTFLYFLEIFISGLQAYIFFSLLVLYGLETTNN
jgi:ATP synthase subunit 6